MSFEGASFFMFGLTYSRYALLLAGMPVVFSVATAFVGFVLSRFSENYAKLVIKAVPLGLIAIVIGYASVNVALSNQNTIFMLFGRCLPAPEVIVCGLLLIIGAIIAVVVTVKEKRIDVV